MSGSSPSPGTPRGARVGEAFEPVVMAFVEGTAGQVLLFAACWVGVGLATAVVLRRRAHEFGPNAALGAVLGPVFVFLAYDMVRRREDEKPIELAPPPSSTGPAVLAIVAGELGDPFSARTALASIGETGPVTAAVPVEYEVAERVHRFGDPAPPSSALDDLAASLAEFDPGLMMLPGRLGRSIPRGVAETGAELVVIVGTESESIAPGLESQLSTHVVRAIT
ncbi:MAG TPA: hypothetical protein VFT85_03155 [Acidimicrobiia bacterium]|nr:hypothetical protein [Acidimicrobiia bacterium]